LFSAEVSKIKEEEEFSKMAQEIKIKLVKKTKDSSFKLKNPASKTL